VIRAPGRLDAPKTEEAAPTRSSVPSLRPTGLGSATLTAAAGVQLRPASMLLLKPPEFYLAGGIAPYGAYSRIFMNSYTKQLQQSVERRLVQSPPDYILTRSALQAGTPEYDQWIAFGVGPRSDSLYADTWTRLEAILHRNYRLEDRMAPYELWRRGTQTTGALRP
jgi:hypothetical protein